MRGGSKHAQVKSAINTPPAKGRSDKAPMWKRLEQVFAICALLFCAGALAAFLSNGDQIPDEKPPSIPALATVEKLADSQSGDPTKVNPAMVGVQLSIYSGVALLLFRDRKRVIAHLGSSRLLWALIVLAFLSVLWSDVPGFALRRSLDLAATSGIGLYLGYRYSPRQLLRLLGVAIAVAVVASLVVVIARPDLGMDSEATSHAWRGIFGQKNTFGRLLSLGVLVFGLLALDSKAHRRAYCAALIVCAGLLIPARSVTSVLSVPFLIATTGLIALCRRRTLASALTVPLIGLTGLACAITLFVTPGDLVSLLGRDASFSGRSEIWMAVWPKIMAHPWLGYGYSSFWLGKDGQSSSDLWAMLRWHVPHSHNGFLDLTEELGLAGLVLFTACFVLGAKRGLVWARAQSDVIGLWPLAYLVFMFFFNLTEGSILRQDNLFWVLYVATFVFVSNEARHTDWEGSRARATRLSLPLAARYAGVPSAGEEMGCRP